jgi:molybdopterin converting factor small subunit
VREGRRGPNGRRADSNTELETEKRQKTQEWAYDKSQPQEITLMQVSFKVPGPLREFTENQSTVRVQLQAGANLLQGLQELFVAYPGLRDRVLTETGETRQHVNIFVGNENVRYLGGLATPIPAGAEISIVPAITGG